MNKARSNMKLRIPSLGLLVVFLYQIFFPTVSWALTGGPSQPEVESFEPVGTSEMVDLFSGDFNYNIPLLDIDGYPINIAYHSGVTTDQEASWVGLGWNINPGVINRNMRGIPDDFNGDEITKIQYVKPDKTYGTNFGVGFEIFGRGTSKIKKLLTKIGLKATMDISLGINYNNYKGLGIESRITPGISAADKAKETDPSKMLQKIGFSAKIDIASSSKDGFSIRPQVGIRPAIYDNDKSSLRVTNNTSIGITATSRGGLKSLSIQSGISAGMKRPNKPEEPKDGSKRRDFGGSIANGGATITFGAQTYTPAVGMEFNNSNFSLREKFGYEITGLNPSGVVSGYFASQELVSTSVTKAAFGTMYLENRSDNSQLLDFNREKDGSYSAQNPTLAVPIHTYDLFNASGQGVSGMYKPYRSDLPAMSDPDMRNVSTGASVGLELAIGSYFKAGLNPIVNYTEVKSGSWLAENDLLRKFTYKGKLVGDPLYEPVCFKNIGEKVVANTNTIPYIDIDKGALRPVLGEVAHMLASKDVFLKSDKMERLEGGSHNEVDINNADIVKTKRDRRNQLFSYLTVDEKDYCLETNLGNDAVSMTAVTRNAGQRKSQHITEISILNAQGARYVYGIPAYNNKQYDISFTYARDPNPLLSESIDNPDCSKGQITYDTYGLNNFETPDFKRRRNKGNDHAMNITQTPGYAHSYLLTAVLSADYIDADDIKGPSVGDYGNYTKISYDRVSANYKWRVPYDLNKANYSAGLKSDWQDDNASIVYGEKEIWLTKRIEGKLHYAKFFISKRYDGLGVLGVHGGKDTTAVSYKLDSISLYSINDPDALTPIKTVHFVYTYELCKNIDNSTLTAGNTGKLTLAKLYFTYGSSRKGKFNSYLFKYENGPDGYNPDYNLKAYDRWGNYKPYACDGDNGVHSLDFPYTTQDRNTEDLYASAWSLTSIELPSGGIIKVKYESDDYAYVQDRRAMQMVKIKGFGDDPGNLSPSTTYNSTTLKVSSNLFDEKDPNEIIYFDLPANAFAGQDVSQVSQNILESTRNLLYYNCLVNLYDARKESDPTAKHFEYVRGYTEVEAAGVINTSGNPVGWIKVKLQDGKYHPVAKTAWQYARMYMPQLVYPGSNLRNKAEQGGGEAAKAIIKGILGFVFDAIEMIDGINDKLRRNEHGNHVDVANSWIRINNLNGSKLGGGARVKQIEIDDQWGELSGSGYDMSYGQKYEYTAYEYYNGKKQLISSGVANYEPGIGGDENPFKMPVDYVKKNIGVPNDEFYSEEPFGEAYFPAPSVGYSRVTVKALTPEGISVKQHGTGKVVHEFCTAKEYPVFTSRTGITPKHQTSSPIFKLIGFKMEDHMTATQGYQVELNDMHGKPKAVLNFTQANIDSNEKTAAFSSIEYEYAVNDPNAAAKKLNNIFKVVNSKNQVSDQLVGVESEMILDSRKQSSKTLSGGLALNLDVLSIGIFAVPVFTAWPDFSSEITSFRSAVAIRVINRSGLLKRTIAKEEGSSIVTENILLDGETGETLLTRTYNEYNDPVYNMTVPAHWAYDGMGQAYKNQGAEMRVVNNSSTSVWADIAVYSVSPSLINNYLADGDELILTAVSGASVTKSRMWIYKNAYGYFLMDKDGVVKNIDDPAITFTVKVIRSGRRNMQNTPVMQFVSQQSPVSGSVLSIGTNNKILNANGTVFSDQWGMTPSAKINCNDEYYQKQFVEVLNFLLTSNQLGWADTSVADYKTMDLTGGDAYLNSYIKTYVDLGSHANKFDPRFDLFNSSTGTFGIAFDVSSTGFSDVCAGGVIDGEFLFQRSWKPTAVKYLYKVNANNAMVEITYLDGGVTKYITTNVNFQCLRPSSAVCNCSEEKNISVNPYLTSVKGNWRKKQDWVYYEARDSQNATTNVRKDGFYKSFSSFWNAPVSSTAMWTQTTDTSKWTLTNEITKYNSNGSVIENKDALNRYSAVLFGFNQSLPVAVASNAKYQQIAFDGIEEPITTVHSCPESHLDFGVGATSTFSKVSTIVSHTGKQSYELGQNETVSTFYNVYKPVASDTANKYSYIIRDKDINGLFSPDSGKYVIGAWVKVDTALKQITYQDSINGCRIKIYLDGVAVYSAFPAGPIIEGWQRIEGVFTIPNTADVIKIELSSIAIANTSVWFDDVRIHPFNANMKSYVYDNINFRLMAELDENNYATFYEYDAEGRLRRVKKETERGIVTIKESRNHQHNKKLD